MKKRNANLYKIYRFDYSVVDIDDLISKYVLLAKR